MSVRCRETSRRYYIYAEKDPVARGRAGLIGESRSQGKKERLDSPAPHRNRGTSSAVLGRKEIRTGMLRAARGCAVVSASSWLKASLSSCSARLKGRGEGLKQAQPLPSQSRALALTTGYDKEAQFPLCLTISVFISTLFSFLLVPRSHDSDPLHLLEDLPHQLF